MYVRNSMKNMQIPIEITLPSNFGLCVLKFLDACLKRSLQMQHKVHNLETVI